MNYIHIFSPGGDEPPVTPTKENGTVASTSKQEEKQEIKTPVKEIKKVEEEIKKPEEETKNEEDETPVQTTRPTVVLHSQKMKELKDLLLAEKLNTHAISLHLTAQSQVQVGKKGRGDSESYGMRPKRTRRD